MGERFRFTQRTGYSPPPLDNLVWLRNPDDAPAIERDDLGNEINPPTWNFRLDTRPPYGVGTFAGRRDRAPQTSHEDAGRVYVGVTVWVIRHRPDVAPNAEIKLRDGRVYYSQGEAVERGGPIGGRGERYLEIHTRLRA